MKIKGSIIIFIITIILIGNSCNKIDVPKDTPRCIKQKIKDEGKESTFQSVYKLTYEGKNIYLLVDTTNNGISIISNSDCETICSMGGFVGINESCLEMIKQSTDKTLIWSKE